MSRTRLLIASSFLVLAACQPAAQPSDELVAETPPSITEEVAEAVVETVEPAAPSAPIDAEAEGDHAGEHDDHNEDKEHDDHDEHDHDESGSDHADEHDDHDHAGGEAHVHGESELAVSIDGATISISIEGALANFDLDESLRTLEDARPYSEGVVELIGGECTRDTSDVSIRPIGDHGNLTIDLVYSCASVESLTGLEVTAFGTFAGFEEVDAVILTETGQTGVTLTKSDSRLDLR